MKKIVISFGAALLSLSSLNAQIIKTDSSLQISGSADLYYKYDFAGASGTAGVNDGAMYNAKVGMKQNSLEFGMLDLKIKKRLGAISVNSELAFGQREVGADPSAPPSYNIQNLYASYQVAKKLSITGGIMYRYQTYEKLTATDNFHYTISNSFTMINFLRSAGIKGTYEFNDKAKIVVGMYNSNRPSGAMNRTVATPTYGLSDLVAQGFISEPFGFKGFDANAAIWIEGQKDNGSHFNLQANYKVTPKLKLGLDATIYSHKDTTSVPVPSYNSYVGYAQYAVCKAFTLGVRYDYLNVNEPNPSSSFVKENYYATTLTGALKLGMLTLKAEFKRDWTSKDNTNNATIIYYEKDGVTPSVNASEIVLAAIYNF